MCQVVNLLGVDISELTLKGLEYRSEELGVGLQRDNQDR
jgi:hypothetical protein